MKKLSFLLLLTISLSGYGPPNCYLFEGKCKKACEKAELAIQYAQGSWRSQKHFDESIALCPSFDYSYYEKSVPFAKRGQIPEWKKLIDKAVELDPEEHLANRGWYHFFFLNNYEKAIKDIEQLSSIKSGDIGSTGDAIYHLELLRGICYAEIDDFEKALQVMSKQMKAENHYISLYDHICIGYVQMKLGLLEEALTSFTAQEENNDLADNRYYKAMVLEKLGKLDASKVELNIALSFYSKGRTMEDGYRELPFEIYQIDIESALADLDK